MIDSIPTTRLQPNLDRNRNEAAGLGTGYCFYGGITPPSRPIAPIAWKSRVFRDSLVRGMKDRNPFRGQRIYMSTTGHDRSPGKLALSQAERGRSRMYPNTVLELPSKRRKSRFLTQPQTDVQASQIAFVAQRIHPSVKHAVRHGASLGDETGVQLSLIVCSGRKSVKVGSGHGMGFTQ